MNKPKERILLVENDPELSDLISRQTLKPLGYQVEVVSAVGQALQEARTYAPDVIMADLNLPGLSGKDLLVALNSQGLDVPVIVLAPKGMEGDVIQAFRLGASDLVYWPIREAEVVAVIERVLQQVRARRERESLTHQLNQTNQELQRRVRELTTIFAIGKAVITTTDQQELFNKILEGATFVSEADSGWLLVREEHGKQFYLRAARNVPKEIATRMNQPWDDGLSSLVALSGELLSIHGEPLKRFKVSQLGGAAMVAPVKVKKEVVGLLAVVRKAPHPFILSQQALLEAVADYASISLVNAHLFKVLEEQVARLQAMANSALVDKQIEEEVLARTARELQNLSLEIKTKLDLLHNRDIGRLNHDQGIAVEIIQDKLKSTLEIIELMQLRTKPKSKQLKNQTDLNESIPRVVQQMQAVAHRLGVSLSVELPQKSLLVRADTGHIDKVLEGLLTNAIKYSLHGGIVTLRAECPNETTVRVEVHDDGAGIDPKQLPFIFKPGISEQTSSAVRFGGVGISLALMHQIIVNNGGKLWVESQPGNGTTFYFTLGAISKEK